MVRLCELLVHVADQEDAALAPGGSGVLAQGGLGHGLSLCSGGASDPRARVASDGRQSGELARGPELVGKVGEAEGGEG